MLIIFVFLLVSYLYFNLKNTCNIQCYKNNLMLYIMLVYLYEMIYYSQHTKMRSILLKPFLHTCNMLKIHISINICIRMLASPYICVWVVTFRYVVLRSTARMRGVQARANVQSKRVRFCPVPLSALSCYAIL